MRVGIGIFLVIPALFSVVLTIQADQQGIAVVYPPDKIIMEFDRVGVSLRVQPESAEEIIVNVNEESVLRIVPDQDFECFSLPLEVGVNEIGITARRMKKEVFRTNLRVFRRSDIVGAFKDPPEEFTRNNFHMSDAKDQCVRCHVLKPGEYDRIPISPDSFATENFDKEAVYALTSTCHSCHKSITDNRYVHGPAAVWSCISCHDPDSEPRYAVKKPDTESCFACHAEQKKDWFARKYLHGPVTIGKCAICHSPHASRYPFNLYKASWDLCVNCHADKGTGKHVLGDYFSTEGHPTRDRPDPVRKGKELSCASCHNPHASDSPHLWEFNVTSTFELCQKCHQK